MLNVEIIKQLDEALQGRVVTFEWVKGHANHPMNEAADSRARAASTAYQNRTAVPSGPGWPGAAATTPVEAVLAEDTAPPSLF